MCTRECVRASVNKKEMNYENQDQVYDNRKYHRKGNHVYVGRKSARGIEGGRSEKLHAEITFIGNTITLNTI